MNRCVVLLFAVLAGCASTTYKEFIGGGVVTGAGGTRESVDGMDVWENGAPPRPFRVIGVIDDVRGGGRVHQWGRMGDIVKVARAAGGDAVIVYADASEVSGYVSSGSAVTAGAGTTTGSAVAIPISSRQSKIAVIKYQ